MSQVLGFTAMCVALGMTADEADAVWEQVKWRTELPSCPSDALRLMSRYAPERLADRFPSDASGGES